MARTRTLLTQTDWVRTGQDLLREGGITAVKLSAVRRKLGVTTGSFYHHFDDFGSYLDALADEYGNTNAEHILSEAADLAPAERLRILRRMMEELDIPALDSAMRVWATSNERAAAAVRILDEQLTSMIAGALRDLGFTENEARVRATLAYASGAGLPLVYPAWEVSQDDVDAALALIMTPVPPI